MTEILIAPSLLAADPLNFYNESKAVEVAGADLHHIDVMDGHFVPNLTFGIPLVEALKKIVSIPLDVHIMVSNPDEVALDYVNAGADYLTFHIEATHHAHRLLAAIKNAGAKAGVAINPGTPLETLWPILSDCDIVNVMSVNPGFGGQKFIKETSQRIHNIYCKATELAVEKTLLIEVDGGINDQTCKEVCQAKANVLVAGTFVYQSKDRRAAISALRQNGIKAYT